jgi:hypothetical protein
MSKEIKKWIHRSMKISHTSDSIELSNRTIQGLVNPVINAVKIIHKKSPLLLRYREVITLNTDNKSGEFTLADERSKLNITRSYIFVHSNSYLKNAILFLQHIKQNKTQGPKFISTKYNRKRPTHKKTCSHMKTNRH